MKVWKNELISVKMFYFGVYVCREMEHSFYGHFMWDLLCGNMCLGTSYLGNTV